MKKEYEEYISKTRKPDYPIIPAILNRHSPRVLKDEEVTQEELLTLLEAARWAPSSSNSQPWRFIVAKKGTDEYEVQKNLLIEFNQKWTGNATYLITLVSKQINDKGEESRNASSDAGAAWENLAIQASDMDLVAHAMGGYDVDKACAVLNVPNEYRVEFMIAVGRRTPLEEVPEQFVEGETPNTRNPLHEIIFNGKFGKEFNI